MSKWLQFFFASMYTQNMTPYKILGLSDHFLCYYIFLYAKREKRGPITCWAHQNFASTSTKNFVPEMVEFSVARRATEVSPPKFKPEPTTPGHVIGFQGHMAFIQGGSAWWLGAGGLHPIFFRDMGWLVAVILFSIEILHNPLSKKTIS